MHNGAYEQEVSIPRPLGRVIGRTFFAEAHVHCDNKPQQISLDHGYNMTYLISTHEC